MTAHTCTGPAHLRRVVVFCLFALCSTTSATLKMVMYGGSKVDNEPGKLPRLSLSLPRAAARHWTFPCSTLLTASQSSRWTSLTSYHSAMQYARWETCVLDIDKLVSKCADQQHRRQRAPYASSNVKTSTRHTAATLTISLGKYTGPRQCSSTSALAAANRDRQKVYLRAQ